MYDFLSFVRDTGVEVKILPPREGVLICLEVRESEHGFCERRHTLTECRRRKGRDIEFC